MYSLVNMVEKKAHLFVEQVGFHYQIPVILVKAGLLLWVT